MRQAWIVNAALALVLVVGLGLGTRSMVEAAAARLRTGGEDADTAAAEPPPVVAAMSEVGYCNGGLKTVLRRVLKSCGLIGTSRRGCQPGELKSVAQIDDADFNALFGPLRDRGGVLLFDRGKDELDAAGKALLDKLWTDRRGASYFFVVARASTDGSTEKNQILSHKRANSILFYLQERWKDPDIEKTVGLLWLGEEYAQLGTDHCTWTLSRDGKKCTPEAINRSALSSWIDCRL